MIVRKSFLVLFGLAASLILGGGVPPEANGAIMIGPAKYLAFDNSVAGAGTAISPFSGLSFGYFHLQDFESATGSIANGSTIAPGATLGLGSGSIPLGIRDSVDGDDGVIDGSGLTGKALFTDTGATGFRFDFSSTVLGALPTHAGIVWTDGPRSGNVVFEAFGPGNVLLGSISLGGFQDSVFNGTTAEDRFFGVIDTGGIASIAIRGTGGQGLEVDHLQYGQAEDPSVVPEPAAFAVWGALILLAIGYRQWGAVLLQTACIG